MEEKILIGNVDVCYIRESNNWNWSENQWPVYCKQIAGMVFYMLGDFPLHKGDYTVKLNNVNWHFNARVILRDRKYYCYIPEPQMISKTEV